jgi:hypothetical protein
VDGGRRYADVPTFEAVGDTNGDLVPDARGESGRGTG